MALCPASAPISLTDSEYELENERLEREIQLLELEIERLAIIDQLPILMETWAMCPPGWRWGGIIPIHRTTRRHHLHFHRHPQPLARLENPQPLARLDHHLHRHPQPLARLENPQLLARLESLLLMWAPLCGWAVRSVHTNRKFAAWLEGL